MRNRQESYKISMSGISISKAVQTGVLCGTLATHFPPEGLAVALVVCTGAHETLIATRKLLLERAGHQVIGVLGEPELIAACSQHTFDVAVVGQSVSDNEKRRILDLVRKHCPTAKVLELFSPNRGKSLDDADDWMEVPAEIPAHLAERVSTLAKSR
jgi:uncharacterized OsmC-like protein